MTAEKESAPGYPVHFTEVQEMPGGRLARDGKDRRDPAAKARRVQDLRGDLRSLGRELEDGRQGSLPTRGVRRRVPPQRAVRASRSRRLPPRRRGAAEGQGVGARVGEEPGTTRPSHRPLGLPSTAQEGVQRRRVDRPRLRARSLQATEARLVRIALTRTRSARDGSRAGRPSRRARIRRTAQEAVGRPRRGGATGTPRHSR